MQQSIPEPPEFSDTQYGSYRVLHPLGAGGMSSVYRAVHVDSGHEVALKVLPSRMARNPIVLQRFLREARIAESLEHPNIVSIYDRGVDQGRHYLVLEYVEGCDLHEYVQMRGPLSAAEAVQVIRQVAEGLRFAADRGLVHRDIKPSNILRSKTGEIKITDLGLALHLDFEDQRVTREGTTVGTVDYMAPEQARDSRAASVQSDIYSLGCTFYYLLTGVPPYPGGDITDKLTRHARSAPPNVRDLRPDVPESLARIMLRMMAKKTDERYASFDTLIEEMDRLRLKDEAQAPGVALAPIDPSGSPPPEIRQPRQGVQILLDSSETRPPSSVPEISLASLPPELLPDASSGRRPSAPGNQALVPLPRRGAMVVAGDSFVYPLRADGSRQSPLSASAWVALCVAIGASFVLLVIVIDRCVRSAPPVPVIADAPIGPDVPEPGSASTSQQLAPAPPPVVARAQPVPAAPLRPVDVRPVERAAAAEPPVPAPSAPAPAPPPPAITAYTEETLRKYLPSWALAPVPERVEGPLVVVRRVAAAAREPSVLPSLRQALNETRGTVEIADEGPFPINDFRIPGETRLVRARPGFRPIIRIDRPNLEAVWSLPGIIVLDGKNLVLDSLDFIVNVRDLNAAQTAFFHCTGASLTVRNCTFTLINAASQTFTLVRADGAAARGSRIRFEKTLIRGYVTSGFDLGKGAVDVALRETVFLGSQGPLVRAIDPARRGEQRFSVVGSVLASRGPAFEWRSASESEPARPTSPMVIRAFDSVFGRFQGAGIACILFSENASASPRQQFDWLGQQNLFCGWKGYYASGPEQTLRLASLSELRSTWNGSDLKSREILAPWPQPTHLGQAIPADFGPFVPGREGALSRAATPRAFLTAKTLWNFPAPEIPFPVTLSGTRITGFPQVATDPSIRFQGREHRPPAAAWKNAAANASAPDAGVVELPFDADAAPWHGDLGAFLHDRLGEDAKHVRVRVKGSGARRSSPIRLRDGLVLEIHAEPGSLRDQEPLSWTPQAESHGHALFEVHGGALLLSQVRLRADESAAVDALIDVAEGDLVLHRCQLTAPPEAVARTPVLVKFSSTAEAARTRAAGSGLFVTTPDRAVCLVVESTLITRASALQASLGRGLVALTQSALAAGTDAIVLDPSTSGNGSLEADLVLDHCTLSSEANIIRLGAWNGQAPGPERPWLVTSSSCAFLSSYDRRVSTTVLLRVDEEAMAHGTLFWQGNGDAADVDGFTAAMDESLSTRLLDVNFQWVNFWGSNHQSEITGPRAGSNLPSVRLRERLKPGRVEPGDLILDPGYHPWRPQLDVGADLSLQGITPRSTAGYRRR